MGRLQSGVEVAEQLVSHRRMPSSEINVMYTFCLHSSQLAQVHGFVERRNKPSTWKNKDNPSFFHSYQTFLFISVYIPSFIDLYESYAIDF